MPGVLPSGREASGLVAIRRSCVVCSARSVMAITVIATRIGSICRSIFVRGVNGRAFLLAGFLSARCGRDVRWHLLRSLLFFTCYLPLHISVGVGRFSVCSLPRVNKCAVIVSVTRASHYSTVHSVMCMALQCVSGVPYSMPYLNCTSVHFVRRENFVPCTRGPHAVVGFVHK